MMYVGYSKTVLVCISRVAESASADFSIGYSSSNAMPPVFGCMVGPCIVGHNDLEVHRRVHM